MNRLNIIFFFYSAEMNAVHVTQEQHNVMLDVKEIILGQLEAPSEFHWMRSQIGFVIWDSGFFQLHPTSSDTKDMAEWSILVKERNWPW